jgi:hypothetical protein
MTRKMEKTKKSPRASKDSGTKWKIAAKQIFIRYVIEAIKGHVVEDNGKVRPVFLHGMLHD